MLAWPEHLEYAKVNYGRMSLLARQKFIAPDIGDQMDSTRTQRF